MGGSEHTGWKVIDPWVDPGFRDPVTLGTIFPGLSSFSLLQEQVTIRSATQVSCEDEISKYM